MSKPKTRRGTVSKERIFQAAIALINEKGYDNVTVKEICTLSETTIGSFYHYFDSKLDVIAEYCRQENEELKAFYESLEDESYYDRLIRYFEQQFSYYEKKQKGVISALTIFELQKDKKNLYENPMMDVLKALIEAGQKSGEFKNTYPCTELAELAFYQWYGITYAYTTEEGNYNTEKMMHSVKLFLRILLGLS